MGRPKSLETMKKVVLTLPEEIALKMKFFVEIQGEARTNSDLVIKLVNDLIADRMETLKAEGNWEKFLKKMDETLKKADKIDALFGDSSSDDDEKEEEKEKKKKK